MEYIKIFILGGNVNKWKWGKWVAIFPKNLYCPTPSSNKVKHHAYRDEDDTMTNILKERRSLTISGSLNHSENSVFQIVPQRRSPSKNTVEQSSIVDYFLLKYY